MGVYVEYGINSEIPFKREFPSKNTLKKTPGGFYPTGGFRIS
ncbi:MAG: hypothetical protein QW512_05770 [Thermofilaceae archaeon]